eukprot:jgi/Ulvmu1/12145/UM085_0009.1
MMIASAHQVPVLTAVCSPHTTGVRRNACTALCAWSPASGIPIDPGTDWNCHEARPPHHNCRCRVDLPSPLHPPLDFAVVTAKLDMDKTLRLVHCYRATTKNIVSNCIPRGL